MLQLVDWYVAIFVIPVFGFIECLIFGWIYGNKHTCLIMIRINYVKCTFDTRKYVNTYP